ncbi:MAG: DUF2147 domain-containing protein [Gammaproteobacteria bacterium]|nr:DUF2147 domain-containing protein [Gammaproteobacteria bacterium]
MSFRKTLSFVTLFFSLSISTIAFAADPLHNTRWQTFDDKTGKAKGVVEFSEQNGLLSGKITKVLIGNPTSCKTCKGKYANTSLIGVTVINDLKPKGKGKYGDGTIVDPKKDKTYKLKVTLKGNILEVRGYLGISLLGRTQTWKKLP